MFFVDVKLPAVRVGSRYERADARPDSREDRNGRACLAAATTPYDRNVCAQVRDEYKRYAEARAKQLANGEASATAT